MEEMWLFHTEKADYLAYLIWWLLWFLGHRNDVIDFAILFLESSA